MQSKKTMANHSFDMLAESGEFMNLVLHNITSCVLLLDKDMRLQAFNNALKTIFSNKTDEDLLYMLCGEAIGCAYQIEEAKDCGKTSKCCTCELRLAAFDSYLNNWRPWRFPRRRQIVTAGRVRFVPEQYCCV
ncbi:hypothetical protein [Draconibacterium orientale]|uniref:hypothetical protein n=1 Tax=Draconibacterium orientale TaxID=1168034 RepID=UPI002ABD478E|nr:hypothetical protein [Draconibacterium orientale]